MTAFLVAGTWRDRLVVARTIRRLAEVLEEAATKQDDKAWRKHVENLKGVVP